jgi:aspartyl-tRNA(Asn)/glutamyl-tRNA(Gln) amidotransferase subunit B
MLSNWLLGELFALLNKHGKSIAESHISPKDLAELTALIKTDVISGKIAKDVLEIMWESRKHPADIVEENGWQQITSSNEIEAVIQQVLEEHTCKVAEYRSGKEKLFGFFVGQAMQKTQGKANPKVLNEILGKLLNE